MNERIRQLLNGNTENHILPFFWQHGEDEATLREYMAVIDNCHIKAVCVESRPHPDFVGEKWWADMDVILDEARKRQMKVWILDDSHFPTGYANGAVEQAPFSLHRQNICYQGIPVKGKKADINVQKFLNRKEKKAGVFDRLTGSGRHTMPEAPADQLFSVTAFRTDRWEKPLDLTDKVERGHVRFEAPEGRWKLGLCKLSYKCGMHENYINMMQPESVRILIDTVYETHYQHYKEDFGAAIAGFFSDEPELGNGPMYKYAKNLGTPVEQPWSGTLPPYLAETLGEAWKNYLPLLWENEADADQTARVRYAYMNAVTRQVQRAFSEQIGGWCREHRVAYIGHMIEDNNMHCRTGSSLGHYFRGLRGQDMAGIDDIGGQVNPGQEDGPDKYFKFMERDGEFFHYALGKLGSSLAAVDPAKHGNAMCEIFGNYGWSEGFRLEKYLADHFLVRGINYFVPHAFNPKAFPDVDCPPHFYAGGHDPEYRHFSALMDYMNRVGSLISGGRRCTEAALLYHGEAEWAGGCMLLQKPARQLADHQIDFDIVPVDVFTERDYYRTDLSRGFRVNGQEYKVLVIPYMQYVSTELLQAAARLVQNKVPVMFVDALPSGVYDGGQEEFSVPEACQCVPLEALVPELEKSGIPEVHITPADNRIRFMHYRSGYDMYYFVNEGDKTYRGTVTLPQTGSCGIYRAEQNCLERAEAVAENGKTVLKAEIPTRQSLIVFFDDFAPEELKTPWNERVAESTQLDFDGAWERSLCRGIDYPAFGEKETVTLPDDLAGQHPKFSGVIAYENTFTLEKDYKELLLEISDAYEGVQVYVNGQSAGIQIVPVYRFDLSAFTAPGKNALRIEVSTTLERERRAGRESILEILQHNKVMQPTGITGTVTLYGRD